MAEEMGLIDLYNLFRKNVVSILLITMTTTILSIVYTLFLATPMYSASTQMIVTQSTEGNNIVSQSDINTSISLISTYEDIIRNEIILAPVIEELDLNTTPSDLRDQMSILTDSSSQVFSINVENENPAVAALIANTTADFFRESIYEIMNVDNVTIISQAGQNINRVSPNNRLNVIIGFGAGIMLGIGLALFRDLFDNTVQSADDIEKVTDWVSIGQVNQFSKKDLKSKEVSAGHIEHLKDATEKVSQVRERV